MQLIDYNMLDASRLRALQLSSRQRYIAQTGPFYVAFDVLLHNQLNFNVCKILLCCDSPYCIPCIFRYKSLKVCIEGA